MNEITLGTFNDNDIKAIVDEEGNEWLTRNQIAEALGYSDTTTIKKFHERLVEEGVLTIRLNDKRSEEPVFTRLPLTPRHKTYVYNDAAVIEICLESNKPQAKKFRRWIAKQFRVSTANGEVEIKAKAASSETIYGLLKPAFDSMSPMMQVLVKMEYVQRQQDARLAAHDVALQDIQDRLSLPREREMKAIDAAKKLGIRSSTGRVHNRVLSEYAQQAGYVAQGKMIQRVEEVHSGGHLIAQKVWYLHESILDECKDNLRKAPFSKDKKHVGLQFLKDRADKNLYFTII